MTIASGSLALAIQVIATVVLARLLTPRDFGLVAMVTTFSMLLMNFGGNGFTEAVVQRKQIDHAMASNLFWINLSAATLLTSLFAASGYLLAKFFGDAQVAPIAAGMSATIFLANLSVLHLALLKRAMLFSAVAINDIIARAVSVIVSVCFGLAGWGYWALVLGACALPLSTAVGAWILCQWVPGRPRRISGTKTMLWFALNTYGRFGTNYVVRNEDNLLVGWRFGAYSLGFYKKAYDLFALSANQLVSSTTLIAVSALSRVREDRAQFRSYLLGGMTVMAFLGMGLAGDLTLIGNDLIRVLLGPGWGPAGQIFTYFAPGIGAMILYGTHGWIHLSIGRADRWFRWGIVELVVTTLLFLLGLHWGPDGIAIAWCVSFWVLTIPAMWYAGKPIGLGTWVVPAAVWRYIAASLLAVVATGYMFAKLAPWSHAIGAGGAALRIACVSATFGFLYIGTVALLFRGVQPLQQLVQIVREMFLQARESDSSGLGSVAARDQSMRMPAFLVSRAVAKEQPLVSILIPAYNAQEWIADTIQSALEQTWSNKEIIVVDDGSTDQTFTVALRFESRGVRVVTQRNQGASAARNHAYSLSRGEYIQWLDADDLLAPDKVATQMELIGRGVSKRTLLSAAWGRFMYRRRHAKFTETALWCDLSPVEWICRKMEQNIYMQTASWLVSRELTEAAGPWDTRLLSDDDGEYFCRVIMASDGIRFVPESKVYYRTFGYDSWGYIGLSDRKCDAHWLSMQMHISYIRSLDAGQRTHDACMRYLRNNLLYFYPEKMEILEQAQLAAAELGEHLEKPSLSWQYEFVKRVLGWGRANKIKVHLRRTKWQALKLLDRTIFRIEKRLERLNNDDAIVRGINVGTEAEPDAVSESEDVAFPTTTRM